MYATIEASIVTAITFGLLPSSDDVTYYVNIAGIDPEPLVAWYFNDDCQTFSATPPVIPAGEISPPYTPGGTPPVPGDPGYPPTELDPTDDPGPLASTSPFWISFHADGVASVAVAGGADYAEVSTLMRTIVRIQDICAARLQAHIATADALLTLYLCASLDGGTTWEPISAGGTGPKLTLGALGTLAGSFLNVDPALDGDVMVNVCTKGSGSAVVGNVLACFYVKTTDGLCIEISEGGCAVPAADFIEDFSAADADMTALLARLYLGASALDNVTNDAYALLDAATKYNGNPTLACTYPGVGFDPAPLIFMKMPFQPYNVYGDYPDDILYQFARVALPADTGSGVISGSKAGFILGYYGANSSNSVSVSIRNGRWRRDEYNGITAVNTATDLGDASAFVGRENDLLMVFGWKNVWLGSERQLVADGFTMQFYAGPACEPMELISSTTLSGYDNDPQVTFWGAPIGTTMVGPVHWEQFAVSNESTPFNF